MKSALPCPLACPTARLPGLPAPALATVGERQAWAASAVGSDSSPSAPRIRLRSLVENTLLSSTAATTTNIQTERSGRGAPCRWSLAPSTGLSCLGRLAARSPARLRGLLVFDSYADLTDSDSGGGGGEEGRKGAKAADSFLPSLALWVRRSHYLLSSGSGEKLAAETAGGAVEPIVEGTSGLRREGTLGSRTFTFARGTPRDPPWK